MRILSLFVLVVPAVALAGGMDRHQLMAGSGIAHPSLNQSTGTNPAGLIGADRFKLALGLGSSDNGANDLDLSAGLLFGNDSGRWAGTIGAGDGHGDGGIFVGAATHLRAIDTAIGVGYGRREGAAAPGAGSLNIGAIVNPATINTIGDAALRVAGVVYGVNGDPSLGAGFEWDSGRTFGLVTDVVAPTDFSYVLAHPAVLVSSGSTSFTLGYRFMATGGSGGDLTLGVSMNVSRVDFQFYLNQLDHLFLSVAFRL